MSKIADEVLKVREKMKAESLAKWKHNLEVAEAMDWRKWESLPYLVRSEIAARAFKETSDDEVPYNYATVPYIYNETCPYCKACLDTGCECIGCPLYAGDDADDDISCCEEWERVRDALLVFTKKEHLITAIKAMIEKIEGIDVSLPEREYLTQYRIDGTDNIPEDEI